MKHLKDAALGLVITVLLFAIAEGGLWIVGLGEPDLATPLSRGFDATVQYLVPDPEVDGGFMTTFSDGKFPERHIAPKSERFRVAMFGGSNTATFRGEWLQVILDELVGAGVYEVVNLGREGYGSERVAIILDQALEKLDPDLVLIYSGHNEFIERGFQMDLEDVWSTKWGRDIGEYARRSRIVNAMTTMLAPKPEPSFDKPEKQREEYSKFENQTWAEAQVFFDAYRQNLERMCRRATESGADVMLSTVVYNRFTMPFVGTLPSDMSADEVAAFEKLRGEIEEALPKFLGPLVPRVGWEHMFMGDWDRSPKRGGTPKLPGLRECFGVLQGRDQEFATPNRKARRVYKTLARVHARDFSEEERRGLETAARLLERALELVPKHPISLFEAALVGLMLEGDEETLVERFELAGSFDRAPRRASRHTNSIVKEVAAEFGADVLLFDADALWAERMPMQLVGYEWMMDECHMVIGGRRVILSDFAEAILERCPQ